MSVLCGRSTVFCCMAAEHGVVIGVLAWPLKITLLNMSVSVGRILLCGIVVNDLSGIHFGRNQSISIKISSGLTVSPLLT